MNKNGEKIIYLYLNNRVLSKIFDEVILSISVNPEKIKFAPFDVNKKNYESLIFIVCDQEGLKLIRNHKIYSNINKIYLISNNNKLLQTNYEAVIYNFPFKIYDFCTIIINDFEQQLKNFYKIVNFNFFSYDKSLRKIFNKEISLHLTEKENEIFSFLLLKKDNVLKEELLKEVWKYNNSIDTHTLETHIYSLRKKLEGKLCLKNILLHQESGYILNTQVL